MICFRWETTATNDGITPATGGAALVYSFSSTLNTVTGGFNSVLPSAYDSYLEWRSTNGTLKEDSSKDEKVAADAFKKYCLLTKPDSKTWPDMMGTLEDSSYFSKAPAGTKEMKKLHKTIWKSTQGMNQFCVNQVWWTFLQLFLAYSVVVIRLTWALRILSASTIFKARARMSFKNKCHQKKITCSVVVIMLTCALHIFSLPVQSPKLVHACLFKKRGFCQGQGR